MISDEIKKLYSLGGKNEFLVCERCHQECTGTWKGICVDCMRKVPEDSLAQKRINDQDRVFNDDEKLNKWFCSYWMTEDKWMDMHGYFPAIKSRAEKEKDDDDILEEHI